MQTVVCLNAEEARSLQFHNILATFMFIKFRGIPGVIEEWLIKNCLVCTSASLTFLTACRECARTFCIQIKVCGPWSVIALVREKVRVQNNVIVRHVCLNYIHELLRLLLVGGSVLSALPLLPCLPPCQCKTESQKKPLLFDSQRLTPKPEFTVDVF